MLGESNVSEERKCRYCGHKCHCYSTECLECINDVCQKCDCEEAILMLFPEGPAGVDEEEADGVEHVDDKVSLASGDFKLCVKKTTGSSC